jgi:hypothetical protein
MQPDMRKGPTSSFSRPDVAVMFPDSIAVNEALRTLVRMSGKTVRANAAPKKRGG